MGENTELVRLAALADYAVADIWSDPALDRLTELAARILRAPIAMLAFMDNDLQWIRSSVGSELRDVHVLPRNSTFCDHMLAQTVPGPMVILDTHTEDSFREHPYVVGEPHLRFYAGVPIITTTGVAIGSLCAIDTKPHAVVSPDDVASLEGLAQVAISLLETRRLAYEGAKASRRALLLDSMLAVVAQATGCNDALDRIGRLLVQDRGASIGQVWYQRSIGERPQLLSSVHGGEPGGLGSEPHPHYEDLLATAMGTGELVSFQGGIAETNMAAVIGDLGLACMAVLPIIIGEDSYAIVVGFDQPRQDFSDLIAFLPSVRDAMQRSLERKAVEERLRLLGSAIAIASDGVTICKIDPATPGIYPSVFVNQSLLDMTGYAPDELIGRSQGHLNASGNGELVRQIEQSLREGCAGPAVLQQRRKDGTTFSAEIESTAVRDKFGAVTHVVSIQRNIEDRLTAERVQNEQADAFRLLFEGNPLPMWIYDKRSLRFLMVNEAAVEFYGWSREQLLGMTLADIQSPAELPALHAYLEERIWEARVWTHSRVDGSIVRMGAMTEPHPIAGETSMLSALWDMTSVQTAREELSRSNELLSDLAAQLRARTEELTDAHRLAKLGTWRLAPDLKEMTWSDEIYALIGRRREDCPPNFTSLLEHVHADDRKLFLSWVQSTDDKLVSQQVEARIVRADGRLRHVRIDSRVAEDGSLVGYVQDWSDRWETQQALMRSEKLAILGHLTGGVAHDFNNLLTVVTLNLEESISELPESDDLQSILVPALQAAQRCVELTNQLLAYARQAPLRPQAVALDGFFSTARPMIRRALGKGHELDIKISDGRCKPLVDPSQLQTALVNLALNAREAMSPGGQVTIRASKVRLPSAQYQIEDVSPGEYTLITVSDSGTGITQEVLPRIFEPFFTTKGVGAGSGLGLSMVDGFVRQSGGHILVQTSVGEGTTFMLFLPLAKTAEDEQLAKPDRPRALLVEDQPAVLATVARMFGQLGYDVCAVSNAASALEELDRNMDFAVLFTDIVLPGEMDGFALSKAVNARAPKIKILLTSGFSEQDLLHQGLPKADILIKPYKRQDLLNRLQALSV
jgi:PAS domain S-box-containing protein